ncbi:hypothetical protein GAO09_25235 [Rhizobiales bacterium RZME27]|jgi:hypothetical protein|uniref:Uncharacterized protein n=1 Tax=Endobacterium cereale TaxID=2663029 RepID=A0A6A8ADF0_9HYPH|nr:hypothetical protein [Endobacterium cereale]MEB2848489.1 hypothetical protein [Endobacterium cereale]MQY49345.1 hypothetical protein [Endobacterium cereale]
MSNPEMERAPEYDVDAEAAEKAHGDKSAADKVPADEETEGATNALTTPVAPPEMAKDRHGKDG